MQRRCTPVLTVTLGAMLFCAAAGAAPRKLTFTDVAPDPGTRRGPSALDWNHDGSRLAYMDDDGTGSALWVLEPVAGDPQKRLPDEALDDGIDAYHWSPVDDTLLLESGGHLFLLPAAADTPRRLTRGEVKVSDPAFSPDGSKVAFVRSHDLHVLDLASGQVTPLTHSGRRGQHPSQR